MQKINENILKTKFGELVVKHRKRLYLSQEALAERLNIHVRTLGKIENGHSFVSADTLCKLSEIFNVPIKALLDFDSNSDINEQKLNTIIEKLRSGGNEKIDYYYDVINIIDRKYGG